jgi:predicted nucleic acid-binding protein
MEIILDADVLIRGEKGSFDLTGWLASRGDDSFSVAAITIAELWNGVERASGTQQTRREEYLRAMLIAVPIVPYTEEIAYVHAKVWAHLQSVGKMIGYYDLIVAATALDQNCEVASFNRRHFAMVPGLKLVDLPPEPKKSKGEK